MKKKMLLLLFVVFAFTSCSDLLRGIAEEVNYPSWFIPGTYVSDDGSLEMSFNQKSISVNITEGKIFNLLYDEFEIEHEVPGNFYGFTITFDVGGDYREFYIFKEKESKNTVEIEMLYINSDNSPEIESFGWCDLM